MIDYCREHGIDVEASASKPYSMDRNLLHISYEAGILEDPWFDPTTDDNKGMYKLTTAPEDAPDEPQTVELDFEQGDCVAVDGVAMTPAQVMKHLNQLAGTHGVGRVDIIENRFVGMKSRGVYETPGGTILMHAHRNMETLTMDRELMHLRDSLIPRYAELVYNGFWYAPEREALQASSTTRKRRSPAPSASSSTRAASPPPAASRRSPSTTKTSPQWKASKATTTLTMPAASSASTPFASAAAPSPRAARK